MEVPSSPLKSSPNVNLSPLSFFYFLFSFLRAFSASFEPNFANFPFLFFFPPYCQENQPFRSQKRQPVTQNHPHLFFPLLAQRRKHSFPSALFSVGTMCFNSLESCPLQRPHVSSCLSLSTLVQSCMGHRSMHSSYPEAWLCIGPERSGVYGR